MRNSIKEVAHYLDWSKRGRHSVVLYTLLIILGYLSLQLGSIPTMIIYKYVNIDPLQPAPLLYSFVIPLSFLLLFGWIILGRPTFSFFAPSKKILWKDFGVGVLLQWLISAFFIIVLIPQHKVSYNAVFNTNYENTIGLLLVFGIGFLIQTACEELYFRGYLMQAVYRIVPFFPVVIGIQAILFGQLHVGNVKAWGDGFMAGVPYFLHACFFAWAAWRTGSLFFAWGLHYGNNSFLVFFVGTKGDVVGSNAPFLAETASINYIIVCYIISIIVNVLFLELYAKNRFQSRLLLTMLTKKSELNFI